jgi:hypothetical protein
LAGNAWRMREHGTQQLSPWWQPGPGPCPLDCFFFQNQKELVSFAILQARIQQYASLHARKVLVMLQFKLVLPFCSYKHTFYKLVQSSHHIDIFSVHSPNKSQILNWCIFSVHLLKRRWWRRLDVRSGRSSRPWRASGDAPRAAAGVHPCHKPSTHATPPSTTQCFCSPCFAGLAGEGPAALFCATR